MGQDMETRDQAASRSAGSAGIGREVTRGNTAGYPATDQGAD